MKKRRVTFTVPVPTENSWPDKAMTVTTGVNYFCGYSVAAITVWACAHFGQPAGMRTMLFFMSLAQHNGAWKTIHTIGLAYRIMLVTLWVIGKINWIVPVVCIAVDQTCGLITVAVVASLSIKVSEEEWTTVCGVAATGGYVNGLVYARDIIRYNNGRKHESNSRTRSN